MFNKKRLSLILCGIVIISLLFFSYNSKKQNKIGEKKPEISKNSQDKKEGNKPEDSKKVNTSKSSTEQNEKPAKQDVSLLNTSPNQIGNSNGNLINHGLAAAQGDWMVYVDDFKTSSGYLNRSMHDGETGFKKIALAVPSSINLIKDTIYFRGNNDKCIYKCNINDKTPSTVVDANAEMLCVINDWIYYVEGNSDNKLTDSSVKGIYRIKTDGSSKTQLIKGSITTMSISDNVIYYVKNDSPSGNIFKASIDGSNEKQLGNDITTHVISDNGWIYYVISGDGLYKLKSDGTKRTKLANDQEIISFNIKDNWIYYSDYSTPNVINKINIDGKESAKLNISAIGDYDVRFILNLNIIDDYIFFNFSSGKTNEIQLCRVKLDGSSSKIIK